MTEGRYSNYPLGIANAEYRVIASGITKGTWVVLGATEKGDYVTWWAARNALGEWVFTNGHYFTWPAPSSEKLIAAVKDMEKRLS